jgi:ATP-dependent Lon protease
LYGQHAQYHPATAPRSVWSDLSAYTHDEKLHTAWHFFLQKQLSQNDLSVLHVQPAKSAHLYVIAHYTREAGVRALERAIGGIVRLKAVERTAYVDAQGLPPSSLSFATSSLTFSPVLPDTSSALVKRVRDDDSRYDPLVEAEELEKILRLLRHDGGDRDHDARRGVVWGLVVTGMGEGLSRV